LRRKEGKQRRDVRAIYGFHFWQVFVRAPSGYRRLTNP
jgi:hypothetical protein